MDKQVSKLKLETCNKSTYTSVFVLTEITGFSAEWGNS